jgi:hypothetical protein
MVYFAQLYIGKCLFVNSTIKSWNQLPAGLLPSFPCKLNTFRKRVKNVIRSKGIEVGIECKYVKWCDVYWCGVNWRDLCEVMWSVVMWGELTWFMWSDVKCIDVGWTDVIYVKRFCFEAGEVKWVKWVTVKFLWIKVLCTLEWLWYTAGIWLYCDYFNSEYLALCLF